MTDNFNLKKFLTENRLTTTAKAQEEVNEGTETSWKDLWNALQAALDKKDDEESTAALKVIGKAVSSKLKGHVKQGADALKAHLEK